MDREYDDDIYEDEDTQEAPLGYDDDDYSYSDEDYHE